MNEPSIPFAAMVLALLGESAEHLLPPSKLACVHVAPPDRGDADPGLRDVESAALWSDLAIEALISEAERQPAKNGHQ